MSFIGNIIKEFNAKTQYIDEITGELEALSTASSAPKKAGFLRGIRQSYFRALGRGWGEMVGVDVARGKRSSLKLLGKTKRARGRPGGRRTSDLTPPRPPAKPVRAAKRAKPVKPRPTKPRPISPAKQKEADKTPDVRVRRKSAPSRGKSLEDQMRAAGIDPNKPIPGETPIKPKGNPHEDDGG